MLHTASSLLHLQSHRLFGDCFMKTLFEPYDRIILQPSQSFLIVVCVFIASPNALAPSSPNWFSVGTKSDYEDYSPIFVVFLSDYVNKDSQVLC